MDEPNEIYSPIVKLGTKIERAFRNGTGLNITIDETLALYDIGVAQMIAQAAMVELAARCRAKLSFPAPAEPVEVQRNFSPSQDGAKSQLARCSALADLRRKLRRLARHSSTFSGVEASDKLGAVQPFVPRRLLAVGSKVEVEILDVAGLDMAVKYMLRLGRSAE